MMTCPNCKHPLETISYESIEIETCPSCGGEWLDADELGKVVRIREERFDADVCAAAAEIEPLEGVPAESFERELNCPGCGGKTQPMNYGGNSGIILDRCVDCGGFWLDAQELEQVQMVVEGWEARLPDVMRSVSPQLEAVAAANSDVGRVQVSRLPIVGRLVNALINGMIRVR